MNLVTLTIEPKTKRNCSSDLGNLLEFILVELKLSNVYPFYIIFDESIGVTTAAVSIDYKLGTREKCRKIALFLRDGILKAFTF